MSFKSSLIALALMLGLGSWYWFYERKGGEARDQAAEEAKLVFQGLDTALTRELTLLSSKGEAALGKGEGGWSLLRPIKAAADEALVEQVLTALRTLKREETIDEQGLNPADFGLEGSRDAATFTDISGKARTLVFGSDNPTGQSTYAQVLGEKPIFLVQRFAKSNILKEAKDLRDRKVWDFDPSGVEKVKAKGLTLTKFNEPATMWLQQLQNLRVAEFVDETGSKAAAYGLDAASPKVEIWVKGQSKPLWLRMGKKAPDNKGHYYQASTKPLVFSMPEYAKSIIEKKAEDLADKGTPGP